MAAKRPTQSITRGALTVAERHALAKRAKYIGSAERKAQRWWGGGPGLRKDKSGNVIPRPKKQKSTVCPLVTEEDRGRATGWIKEALAAGQYKFVDGDKDFPKHVWHQVDGQGWFGFCINTISGEYKGWPLEEEERLAYFG
jgi:hypothetical protein